MKEVCQEYRNAAGGHLADGSPCSICEHYAHDHIGYFGREGAAAAGCVATPGFPFPEIPRIFTERSANERQVGGDHYKTNGEEHWDRVWRLYGRGYFIGQITKYVERAHKKNGVEDLEKAQHFLQKLIELEKGPVRPGEEYKQK